MTSATYAEILTLNPSEAIAALYPELRRIARRLISRERTHHTLQPTALANEAVARLLQREAAGEDPRMLIAFGIREMRTILIDSGRRYQTKLRVDSLTNQEPSSGISLPDLVHLQKCLDELGQIDPRSRHVVELRFFVGLTIQETADFLGVSPRTVNEDWEFARCWLAANWAGRPLD